MNEMARKIMTEETLAKHFTTLLPQKEQNSTSAKTEAASDIANTNNVEKNEVLAKDTLTIIDTPQTQKK
jgi:hypothetical protein